MRLASAGQPPSGRACAWRLARTDAVQAARHRYVLLNRKHHAATQRFYAGWLDPYSSAIWFRGWTAPIRMNAGFNRQLSALASPTREPRTWLLRVGWQRAGTLSYDDRPSA